MDMLAVENRIQSSFAKQGLMKTMNAVLRFVRIGEIEIELTPSAAISQQHGFTHGGAVSAIADSAAGYAALSTMPLGREVLTTEFKINFLAPAAGERIVARAKVVRAGRTLSVVQSNVFSISDSKERLIALLTATMMAVDEA